MTQTISPLRRKPCLALMGEFSAGKSTLSNLLLGADPMPVKVTATRLPPVWISYGDNSATREDLDGVCHPVDIDQLDLVQLENTRLIRLYLRSDVLKLCDLIDMPGISDPNMDSDVWRAVIHEADHVIWCTHATQAWRQSEAAVWESLPKGLRDKSLLLLTRFDKILTARDRQRVLARVTRETEGLFRGVYPISLIDALTAGEDRRAWDDSGADDFVQDLIGLLTTSRRKAAPGVTKNGCAATPETAQPMSSPPPVLPSRVRPKSGGSRRPRLSPGASLAQAKAGDFLEAPGNV